MAFLDLNEPVSVQILDKAFDDAAVAEHWSPSLRDNRRSYLRRAVQAALAAGAANPEDLRSAIPLLEHHAPPPDGASSVRKTLAILTGRTVPHRVRRQEFTEPLYQPLVAVLALRGGKSAGLANFDLLVRAAGYGHRAPRELPTTKELKAAAKLIRMPKPTMRAAIATYRAAREALKVANPDKLKAFAPVVVDRPRTIGLESLPYHVVAPALEAAGVQVHPADMTWEEILTAIAPALAEDLLKWRTEPRRGERPGVATITGVYAVSRALNRVAAGLLLARRHDLLRRITLLGLWTPSEAPFDEDSQMNPQLARAREHMGLAGCPILHQPIRVAMDAVAKKSRELAGVEDGTYTVSSIQVVQRVWTLTAGVYRRLIAPENPQAWIDIDKKYDTTLAYFRLEEAEPAVERDKNLLLSHITLPQLVCLGLPALERQRQRARRDWLEAVRQARACGHDPKKTPAVKSAHKAYAEAGELRLAPGIYLADGLRLANYRFGVLGDHYVIEFARDAGGRAIGIKRVSTKWDGRPDQRARTKRDFSTMSRRARRKKRNAHGKPWWSSAHVPPDALWQFLEEVTLPRAIASGELAPTADVEELVKAKRFPLFLSSKSGQMWRGKRRGTVNRGGTGLGVQIVGKALWWTAKHMLGRDLPEWEALDRKGEFYRIFVGHDTRLLTSVYWGRIRHQWDYAAYHTNDKVETLTNDYNGEAYDVWESAATRGAPWDHPHAFDGIMDDIRERTTRTVNVQELGALVPPAARSLYAKWDAEDRQVAKGKQKRKHPAGKIRKARPGQEAPEQPKAAGDVGDAAA